MPLIYDGTNIDNVTFNGSQIEKLVWDTTVVWENWKRVTGSMSLGGDKGISSNTVELPSYSGLRRKFKGSGALLMGKPQGWNYVDLILQGIPEGSSSWVDIEILASAASNPDWGGVNNYSFDIKDERGFSKLRLRLSPTTWGCTIRNFSITEWEEK